MKRGEEETGDFHEDVPNAGPTAFLVGHALHLIGRRGRPEDEPLRETLPAQPACVQPHLLRQHLRGLSPSAAEFPFSGHQRRVEDCQPEQ